MKTNQDIREDFICEFTEKDTEEEALRNEKILSFFLSQHSQDIEEIKEWVEKTQGDCMKDPFGKPTEFFSKETLLSFLNSLNK